MDEDRTLAVCMDCDIDGAPMVVPFASRDKRDDWWRKHRGSTGHCVLGVEGWGEDTSITRNP